MKGVHGHCSGHWQTVVAMQAGLKELAVKFSSLFAGVQIGGDGEPPKDEGGHVGNSLGQGGHRLAECWRMR